MKTITFEVDDDDARAIATSLAFFHERNELLEGALAPEGSSDEVGAMLAEICRGWLELLGVTPTSAICIGCGCCEFHACDGGCSWLAIDRELGSGVCSSCPQFLDEFLGQQRVRRLHESLAEFAS